MGDTLNNLETLRQQCQDLKQRMYRVGGIKPNTPLRHANIRKNNPFRAKYIQAVQWFRTAQAEQRQQRMAEWRASLPPIDAVEFADNFVPQQEFTEEALAA